jgi:hypothetical protein
LPGQKQVVRPGETYTVQFPADVPATYYLYLRLNEYFEATVLREGVGAAVTIYGPEGRKLLEVSTPTGNYGRERISQENPIAGGYLLCQVLFLPAR